MVVPGISLMLHRQPYRLKGTVVPRTLPDYARRSLRLFGFTFLGLFSTLLTGWLGQVVEWASASDRAFPGLSPVGKAAVAAFAAAVAAAIAFTVNALEDKGKIPALLKAPASDGADPVPEPEVDPTLVPEDTV